MNGGVSKMIFRLITLLWLQHPVFTLCSTGCVSCYDEALQSICDRCDRGFRLNYPNCSSCPSNCETCTDDYTCQSCKPQFYSIGTQKTCQFPCSSNCTALGCADETGHCIECPSGWYGSKCGENCNLCRNGLCDLRKCSNGCKDGYSHDNSNPSNIYCRPCLKANCMTCFNTTYCTQCNDGFYVRPFITSYGRGEADCQPCSSAYTCRYCDSILNCKTCGRVNERIECSVCEDGYVLDKTQCVENKKPCPTTCNSCDSDGFCNGDCKEGYLGSKCDNRCLSTCKTCTNQISCDSCNDGFHTALCDTACNPNCLGDTPVCRISDGYCLNGCKEGYWGEQCQERCNEHCRHEENSLQVCWRNGTCTHGCYIGYSESDCSKDVSTTTTTTQTNKFTSFDNVEQMTTSGETSTTQITHGKASAAVVQTVSECRESLGPAIGGSISGGCVFGVLASAIVFYIFLSQRSLRKESDRKQSTNVYYNISMSAVHDEESQDDKNVARKDVEDVSSSNKCEETLNEKLAYQSKGNLYDHLDQSSAKDIMREVEELGSSADYYNK